MAHDVIMPALGMAQETGLILAWRKSLGDPVKAGDVLMEVETDKAAMEVEAQADGFLTEVRAAEGAEVPVGEVIAVISASAADVTAAPAPKPAEAPKKNETPAPIPADPVPAAAAPAPAPAPVEPPKPQLQPAADGKLLASPKARRLAAERGLDLNRLAAAGHPQPYRVADLDKLASLPGASAVTPAGGAAERILARASVAGEPFDRFCAWLAGETDTTAGPIAGKVLAAFGAGSLRAATGAASLTVQVIAPRKRPHGYLDPDRCGLSRLKDGDAGGAPELIVPDLIVYDLTETRLTAAEMAAATAPTLTVARDGSRLAVALAATPGQLDDDALIACLDAFAGRLEEPLRQLI